MIKKTKSRIYPVKTFSHIKSFFYAKLLVTKQFILDNPFICVLVVIFVLSVVILDTVRYDRFINGFDFNVFGQTLWHLSNFQLPHSTIRDVDIIWGDHFHPILVSLVPFYWIFDSPKVLIYAQAILVGSALLPFYLYAKKYFTVFIASILSLVLALYGGIQYMVFFEFHEVAFAVPLIAWLIYAIDRGNWKLVYLSAALLLLTKEDMGLLIFFVGIYLILLKHYKKGLIVGGIGIAWFGLLFSAIMPFLADRPNANYWNFFYAKYGSSPADAIKNFFAHPLDTIKMMINDMVRPELKRETLYKTFSPFLFIFPFLSPIIILTVPFFLLRFLSTQENSWTFDLHYAAVPGIIIAFAVVDSFRRIYQFLQQKGVSKQNSMVFIQCLAIAMLAFSVRNMYRYDYPFQNLENHNYYRINQEVFESRAILNRIPDNASVTTLQSIAPQLIDRQDIYVIYNQKYWEVKGPLEVIKQPHTEYVVLNDKLPLTYIHQDFNTLLTQVTALGYNIEYQDDSGWYILKK